METLLVAWDFFDQDPIVQRKFLRHSAYRIRISLPSPPDDFCSKSLFYEDFLPTVSGRLTTIELSFNVCSALRHYPAFRPVPISVHVRLLVFLYIRFLTFSLNRPASPRSHFAISLLFITYNDSELVMRVYTCVHVK